MNKTKLIGLSLLAFSAVSIMASCSGGKPSGKPDVYFRAKAAILEVVDGEVVKKEVDYKDSECAKISIEPENLRYGAQDVVITIEPKPFFTFREYDITTWEPADTPVRPYVGLGNPHTLYSYPLQENVAWTFKDLSTRKEKTPEFYDEKYQITVKKEFFQKNIVIDYGNVGTYNNNVYVYNSSAYEMMFKKAGITGKFQDSYVLDESLSSFTAGSDVAVATYSFRSSDNIFTFKDWDKPKQPSSESNDDPKYYYYDHFEIKGYKKDEKGKTVEEIISRFDPKSEKQEFIPTVNGDSISFSFNWSLLADASKGYEPIYDKISVELKEPTLKTGVNVKVKADDGVTVYKCDYFQYTVGDGAESFSYDGRTLKTYDPTDKAPTNITLSNVVHERGGIESGDQIQYSTLFKMDDNNSHFTISLNDEKIIEVDLSKKDYNLTDWRIDEEAGGQQDKGAETPYWTYVSKGGGSWHLVQLNPQGRTYGLPLELRQGQANLYYLYTTESSSITKGDLNIGIKIAAPTETVSVSLDNDGTRNYGWLDKEGDEKKYECEYDCIGKSLFYVKFYPEGGYKASNFIVNVACPGTTTWTGFYTPAAPDTVDYGLIRIESTDGSKVTADDKFTIKLTLGPTVASIDQLVLGGLIDNDGNPQPQVVLNITEGATDVTVTFQFGDSYYDKALLKNEDGSYKLSDDVKIEAAYNGSRVDSSKITISENKDVPSKRIDINISTGTTPIDASGDAFNISVKFAPLVLETKFFPGTEDIPVSYAGGEVEKLYDVIGTRPEKLVFLASYDITQYGLPEDVSLTIDNTPAGDVYFSEAEIEGEKYLRITASKIDYSEYNSIQNGSFFTILLTFAEE